MKDNSKTIVSVIIPAYNEEKYIAETLKNLLEQDFSKELFEIIVVDNDSTDKTFGVASSFGVRVIEYDKIHKVSAARQAGVDVAKGAILAFTDADTLVSKDWLSGIVSIMANEKVVAVGGKIIPIGAGSIMLGLFNIYDLIVKIHGLFGRYMFWGNNLAVRASALKEVGGFNTTLATSEDWELLFRMSKRFSKKGKIVYSAKIVNETSNRKQQSSKVFIEYFFQGLFSYVNVVLFGRAKSADIMTIR